LITTKRGKRVSVAILCHEFHIKGVIRIAFNDCTNLATTEVVLRQVYRECHDIEQLYFIIHEPPPEADSMSPTEGNLRRDAHSIRYESESIFRASGKQSRLMFTKSVRWSERVIAQLADINEGILRIWNSHRPNRI